MATDYRNSRHAPLIAKLPAPLPLSAIRPRRDAVADAELWLKSLADPKPFVLGFAGGIQVALLHTDPVAFGHSDADAFQVVFVKPDADDVIVPGADAF